MRFPFQSRTLTNRRWYHTTVGGGGLYNPIYVRSWSKHGRQAAPYCVSGFLTTAHTRWGVVVVAQATIFPPSLLGTPPGKPTRRHPNGSNTWGSQIIKSYMLPVWTEWDYPGSPCPHETCASIQGSSPTIGLNRLDLGSKHLRKHEPSIDEGDIRAFPGFIAPSNNQPPSVYRVPLDIHVFYSSPVPVAARLGPPPPPPELPHYYSDR